MTPVVTQFAWYDVQLPLWFYATLFTVTFFFVLTGETVVSRKEFEQIRKERRLEYPEEYLANQFFMRGVYRGMIVPRWLIMALFLQAPLWMILSPRTMPLHLLAEATFLAMLFSPDIQHVFWDVLRPKLILRFFQRSSGGGHPSQSGKKKPAGCPLRNFWGSEEDKYGHGCHADTNGIPREPQYKPDPSIFESPSQNAGQIQNGDVASKNPEEGSEYVRIKIGPWFAYQVLGTGLPSTVQKQPVSGGQQKRKGQ